VSGEEEGEESRPDGVAEESPGTAQGRRRALSICPTRGLENVSDHAHDTALTHCPPLSLKNERKTKQTNKKQNRKNTPERLELMKYNKHLKKHTLHREVK
jgi:ribosomal protein L33